MAWVLKFWKSTALAPATPVTWNYGTGDVPSDVPVSQVTDITNYLASIASISPLAATKLNGYGQDIRVGYSAGEVGHAFAGPFDDYIIIDLVAARTLYIFNTLGQLVAGDVRLTIMHELAHIYLLKNDPPPASEATMNGADFDFRGPVVDEQNAIAKDAGLIGQVQTSYLAWLLSTDSLYSSFSKNVSYSDNNNIDITRLGTSGNNNIDHSNNTELLNDLIFGLDGDDTIKVGKGDDYVYGGEGSDKIWGGDGNDVLMGDDGGDEFRGEKGNDTIWGGAKGAQTGRSDGVDTVFYDTAAGSITITLAGSSVPILSVSDGDGGTDTLHSIEIIQGSSHDDKLILQALTSQIAAAFDYIDLGGGNDTVDILGLSGSVTVNLLNPLNQTVTFGSAVLKLRHAERVTGGEGGDKLYVSAGTANTILAGSGDDTIYLAGSGHTIAGGGGYDVLDLAAVVTGSRIRMASDSASIRGSGKSAFDGFEEVVGSEGGAVMYGDGRGTKLVGGAGVNYLEGSGTDVLEGGSGDTYFSLSKGGTAISGAGNDYIEASGSEPVTIRFGIGSGHDMLGSWFEPGGYAIDNDSWIAARQNDMIWLEGLTKDDIELVWDYTEVGSTAPGSFGDFDDYYLSGEAAIRVKSTGATLYLGELSYNRSHYYARYELYFLSLISRDYDKALAALASGAPGFGPGNGPSWAAYTNNDVDNEDYSVELAIFSFDGVTRLNIFDLFDLSTVASQALPPEAKATAGILGRLGQAGDESVTTGTPGADNLAGGAGDEDLLGAEGDDVVAGGAGDDIVRSGPGNDLIVGGPGNDSYDGGSGRDRIDFGWTAAGVAVDLLSGVATGAEIGSDQVRNVEDAIGGSGTDRIFGNGDNNRLAGGAGRDVLAGRGGADELDGGPSEDILQGGAGWDSYVWRPGHGSDEIVDQAQGSFAENTLRIEGASLADFTVRRNPVTLDGALILTATGEIILIRLMFAGGGKGVAEFDFRAPRGGSVLHSVADLAAVASDDPALGISRSGTAGNDVLAGTSGDDTLYGLDGDDALSGLEGNDILDGGTGADSMSGGAGDDLYIVDNAADTVNENAGEGTDTIQTSRGSFSLAGLPNVETLTGTSGSGQVLTGNAADNAVNAGPGNDILHLWVGGGNDRVDAGAGNDTIFFGATLTSADAVIGGAGADTLVLQGNYAGGLTLTADVTSIENISILAGSNVALGHSGTDRYDYVLTTQDSNVAAGVQARINGSALLEGEDFTFDGSAETDAKFVVYGGRGTDTLTGGLGNDIFFFDAGRFASGDRVSGGQGYDGMFLRGNYTIDFNAPGYSGLFTSIENLTLTSATDERYARGGGSEFDYSIALSDALVAAGETLVVSGAMLMATETMLLDASRELDAVLRLFGGKAADTLKGGALADTLHGNLGADSLTGGGGADTFRYDTAADSSAASLDHILDFTPGTDKLDLSRIDADALAVGDQAFSWIGSNLFSGTAGQLRAYQSGGDWFLEGDMDGDGAADLVIALTLQEPTPLGPADFLL